MTHAPVRGALLPLCAAVSLLSPAVGLAAKKPPAYSSPPGTPVCTVEQSQPVVCAWTIDNLVPVPDKYAVEVVATYDPDCNGSPDLAQTFKLSTANGNPVFDIAPALLDVDVCTSGDTPCTVHATWHAKTVQVRVKANSSAKGGSQASPFSALSTPVTIPGTCLCPSICVSTGNHVLAAPPSLVHHFACGLEQGKPLIDWHYESNAPLPPDSVSTGYLGAFGVGEFESGCSEEGPVNQRDFSLTEAEINACMAQFAPQFAQHFNFACDPNDPARPMLINYTPP
jgi:hypothetical protein